MPQRQAGLGRAVRAVLQHPTWAIVHLAAQRAKLLSAPYVQLELWTTSCHMVLFALPYLLFALCWPSATGGRTVVRMAKDCKCSWQLISFWLFTTPMLITNCMVFEVDMVRPIGMQYVKWMTVQFALRKYERMFCRAQCGVWAITYTSACYRMGTRGL